MEPTKIETFLNSPCSLWSPCGDTHGTWREWLEDVILTLLKEGEGFSGKRPNCDSGWQYRLAAEGLVLLDPAVVTEWEEEEVDEGKTQRIPVEVDWDKYEELCEVVVAHLFKTGVNNETASEPASA